MIIIGDGKLTLQIKVGNYEISKGEVSEVKLVSEWNNTLPAMMLILSSDSEVLFKECMNDNTKVRISIGNSIDNMETFTFVITTPDIKPKSSGRDFRLYGISDMRDYLYTPKSYSKSGTSDEVLKIISSVKPDIEFKGNDSQIWLNANTTDKIFVDNIIAHSYISSDSAPLFALTFSGTLKVRDSKKELSKKPKYTLSKVVSADKPNEIKCDVMGSVETNYGIFNQLAGYDRELVVQDLIGNKMLKQTTDSFSDVSNGTMPLSEYKGNIPFNSKIKYYSCHDNYHNAKIQKLKIYSNLMNLSYKLNVSKYIMSNEIDLLDVVRVKMSEDKGNGNSTGTMILPLSGRFTVFTKVIHLLLSNDKVDTYFVVGRDTVLED